MGLRGLEIILLSAILPCSMGTPKILPVEGSNALISLVCLGTDGYRAGTVDPLHPRQQGRGHQY